LANTKFYNLQSSTATIFDPLGATIHFVGGSLKFIVQSTIWCQCLKPFFCVIDEVAKKARGFVTHNPSSNISGKG
jgi:hypothetical protein